MRSIKLSKKYTVTLFGLVFLFLFSSGNYNYLYSDMFYTQGQYNKLKNEKIAIELELNQVYRQKVALERELKSLKEQYANDRLNLGTTIKNQESKINDLNRRIAKIKKNNKEEKNQLENRIKELLATINLLKRKGSNREKALIEINKGLQKKYENQLNKLREKLRAERENHNNEINELRKKYDDEIAKLLEKINNLNNELSALKKLTESQKKELNRMTEQSNELEKQLKDEIRLGQIRLKKFHDKLIINIDNKISFNSGSAKLKRDILHALRKISNILKKFPENNIIIEGHTDNVRLLRSARFRDNWHLSTERALAVLNYILKSNKMNNARFSASGYGEYHPIVPNNSTKNRALNRRVDIVVIPRIKQK